MSLGELEVGRSSCAVGTPPSCRCAPRRQKKDARRETRDARPTGGCFFLLQPTRLTPLNGGLRMLAMGDPTTCQVEHIVFCLSPSKCFRVCLFSLEGILTEALGCKVADNFAVCHLNGQLFLHKAHRIRARITTCFWVEGSLDR